MTIKELDILQHDPRKFVQNLVKKVKNLSPEKAYMEIAQFGSVMLVSGMNISDRVLLKVVRKVLQKPKKEKQK